MVWYGSYHGERRPCMMSMLIKASAAAAGGVGLAGVVADGIFCFCISSGTIAARSLISGVISGGAGIEDIIFIP